MNNETMNNLMKRGTVLLLTAYYLLLTFLPAAAQEEDPLATAVLLPGVVGWLMVGLAIVLMVVLSRWMRSR